MEILRFGKIWEKNIFLTWKFFLIQNWKSPQNTLFFHDFFRSISCRIIFLCTSPCPIGSKSHRKLLVSYISWRVSGICNDASDFGVKNWFSDMGHFMDLRMMWPEKTSKLFISSIKRATYLSFYQLVVLISTTKWKIFSWTAHFNLEIYFFKWKFSLHISIIISCWFLFT